MVTLTLERLRALLSFEAGEWRWRVARGGSAQAGAIAGRWSDGYYRIRIDDRDYDADRLAVFYNTGRWPPCPKERKPREQEPARHAFEDIGPAIEVADYAPPVTIKDPERYLDQIFAAIGRDYGGKLGPDVGANC